MLCHVQALETSVRQQGGLAGTLVQLPDTCLDIATEVDNLQETWAVRTTADVLLHAMHCRPWYSLRTTGSVQLYTHQMHVMAV